MRPSVRRVVRVAGVVVVSVVLVWVEMLPFALRTGSLPVMQFPVLQSPHWPCAVPEGFPPVAFKAYESVAEGRTRRLFVAPVGWRGDAFSAFEEEFGWPLASFGIARVIRPLPVEPSAWTFRGGVSIPEWLAVNGALPLGIAANRIVPIYPRWPGLIVMTAAHAAAILGVRWAVRWGIAHGRRRSGLCVRCAYDVTGLVVCPECGKGCGVN